MHSGAAPCRRWIVIADGPFLTISSRKPRVQFQLIDIRSGGDERQFLAISRHPRRISAKFHRIFSGSEIAAASPRFVAHAPVTNTEGFGKSRRSARVRQSCTAGRRIAIFHPAIKFLRRKAAHVGGKIRLGSNQFAEMQKFICSELIGIVLVTGRSDAAFAISPEIGSPRTLVAGPMPSRQS